MNTELLNNHFKKDSKYNTDLFTDVPDINKHVGKSVYLLILDNGKIIAGSTRKYDIDTFLEDNNIFEEYGGEDAQDSIILLYGIPINMHTLPKDTPTINNNYDLYLIASDNGEIDYMVISDIDEVVKYTEKVLEYDKSMTIEDIAVMYATQVRLKLQSITPDVIDSKIKKEFLIDDKY